MKTAMQFAQTAKSYATKKGTMGKPSNEVLGQILGNIERITMLGRVSDAERGEALDVAWDAYAKVLSSIDSMQDESWGGAKRIGSAYASGLDIIDDEQLASVLMYGESDDDGRD